MNLEMLNVAKEKTCLVINWGLYSSIFGKIRKKGRLFIHKLIAAELYRRVYSLLYAASPLFFAPMKDKGSKIK
jgi:hypothetical protein